MSMVQTITQCQPDVQFQDIVLVVTSTRAVLGIEKRSKTFERHCTGISSPIGSIRGRQQDTRLHNRRSTMISLIKDITSKADKGQISVPSNTAD
jgi:hypothetical protein